MPLVSHSPPRCPRAAATANPDAHILAPGRGHDGAVSTPSTAAAPPRTPPGSTFAPRTAWPARAVARAEAPLTARTDRYMRAAAHAVAAAARAELRRARGRLALTHLDGAGGRASVGLAGRAPEQAA